VNTQTLRYYERRRILHDPPRSAAGHRDYPESAVAGLRFIKRAQELGFALAEIEELLGLAEGGPESCDAARSLAEAHIAGLEHKIADRQRMRASLAALVDTCQRRRADRSCPLLAAIESDVSLVEVPAMKLEVLHVLDCPNTGVLSDRLAALIVGAQ
jgi:DNA-binding transcriptional MerR regulator